MIRAPAARPLPWVVVGAMAAAIVALLAFLTLYLPARRAQPVVRVDGLTLRLSATALPAGSHGVRLRLTVEPPLDDAASLELAPSMPTMGNMTAPLSGRRQVGPGVYEADSDLGMGGLWQVQVIVHRPGQADAVARFRLNA